MVPFPRPAVPVDMGFSLGRRAVEMEGREQTSSYQEYLTGQVGDVFRGVEPDARHSGWEKKG